MFCQEALFCREFGIFFSWSSFNFLVTIFSVSTDGKEVLNRSPAKRMKSTFCSIHWFMALRNALLERSRIFWSLQEPRCRSAKCAYFMSYAEKEKFILIIVVDYVF